MSPLPSCNLAASAKTSGTLEVPIKRETAQTPRKASNAKCFRSIRFEPPIHPDPPRGAKMSPSHADGAALLAGQMAKRHLPFRLSQRSPDRRKSGNGCSGPSEARRGGGPLGWFLGQTPDSHGSCLVKHVQKNNKQHVLGWGNQSEKGK